MRVASLRSIVRHVGRQHLDDPCVVRSGRRGFVGARSRAEVEVVHRRRRVEVEAAAGARLERGDERPGRSEFVEFEAAAPCDADAMGADLRGAGQQRSVERCCEPWRQVATVRRMREHDDVGVGELREHGSQRGCPATDLDRADLRQPHLGRPPVDGCLGGARAGDQHATVGLGDRVGCTRWQHSVANRDQGDHPPSVRSPSSACAITTGVVSIRRLTCRSRRKRITSTSPVIARAVPKASQNATVWLSSNAWPNR
jgi:hypothetical protein